MADETGSRVGIPVNSFAGRKKGSLPQTEMKKRAARTPEQKRRRKNLRKRGKLFTHLHQN